MARYAVPLLFALTGCASHEASTTPTSRDSGAGGAAAAAGCANDLDCKGDRVCVSGYCQAPTSGSGGSPASAGGSLGSGGRSGGSGGTNASTGGTIASTGGTIARMDAGATDSGVKSDSGTPALTGSPLWYGTGPGVYQGLDDPRWAGAPVTSFANDGVGTVAGYRVLLNGNELNVSFQALAPPGGAPTFADQIYLGIASNSGGTSGKIIRIFPKTSGAPDPVPWNSALDLQMFEKTGGAGSWGDATPATSPTWLLDSVYTWRNSPVGAVWAVNLKVDLSGFGLASTAAVHLALGMSLHPATGTTNVDLFTPDYLASVNPAVTGTILPADMTTWPVYLRH